jgi:hypothetical protein
MKNKIKLYYCPLMDVVRIVSPDGEVLRYSNESRVWKKSVFTAEHLSRYDEYDSEKTKPPHLGFYLIGQL